MEMERRARTYRMGERALAAERTGGAILVATGALWREKAIDEFTLQEIADRAGVSVQTVIRRFGSKDGVIGACIEVEARRIEAERDAGPPGDVEHALDRLLGHYERDGDAVLRTLAQEDKLPAAKAIVVRGRASHRQWCARVFMPWLPPPDTDEYGDRLDAFIAATDIYLWKLLRRDIGRSAGETRRVIQFLLEGLISTRVL